MTPEDRTRRAVLARNIWNDPVMKEARAHIEATLLERFKAAPISDAEQLRWLRMLMEAHEVYGKFFQRVLNDGALAQVELDRRKTLTERVLRR